MSGDIFGQCRAAIPAAKAASFYGYEPTSAGFISCPFHGTDSTASLKLYGNGSWYCFGCHKGGSAIDFTAALFGLSPLEAVRKLDSDFNLQLDIGKPMTAQELQEARRRAEQLQTVRIPWKDLKRGEPPHRPSCAPLCGLRTGHWPGSTAQRIWTS